MSYPLSKKYVYPTHNIEIKNQIWQKNFEIEMQIRWMCDTQGFFVKWWISRLTEPYNHNICRKKIKTSPKLYRHYNTMKYIANNQTSSHLLQVNSLAPTGTYHEYASRIWTPKCGQNAFELLAAMIIKTISCISMYDTKQTVAADLAPAQQKYHFLKHNRFLPPQPLWKPDCPISN